MKYVIYNCYTKEEVRRTDTEEQAEKVIEELDAESINKGDFNTKYDRKEVQDNVQLTIFDAYDYKVQALRQIVNSRTDIDTTTYEPEGIDEREEIQEQLDYAQSLFDDGSYLVLTDEEADDEREERIDQYIDDCILPQLPLAYRGYFDDKGFKNDAQHDGRGNTLADYDGDEDYTTVNGVTYFIYRIN